MFPQLTHRLHPFRRLVGNQTLNTSGTRHQEADNAYAGSPHVGQARILRQGSGVEFVTHDASIQPGRYTFANLDVLTAHLGKASGGRPESGGIRGSMSRTGTYSRRAADGTQAVTFLRSRARRDLLGCRVAGHRGPDNRSSGRSRITGCADPRRRRGRVRRSVPEVHGHRERRRAVGLSDNGDMVEYRVGDGRLNFHAWKKNTIYEYWSMGGDQHGWHRHQLRGRRRRVRHLHVSPGSPTLRGAQDRRVARDDSYVDQYDWAWHAQQPERVAVLCRAQWHHTRSREILMAGEGCLKYRDETWPQGFPPDWNTIKTVIELNGTWTDGSPRSVDISIKLESLTIDMPDFDRPAAHGPVVDGSTITATFPDYRTYTGNLQPPKTIRWSNGSAWTKV